MTARDTEGTVAMSHVIGFPDRPRRLTRMENRVLRLISLGCTVKQAAAILGRATRTIDKHKLHGMRKLGVHNQAMLTRRVIQLGVTSLEDALTSQERELAEAARSLKRRRA